MFSAAVEAIDAGAPIGLAWEQLRDDFLELVEGCVGPELEANPASHLFERCYAQMADACDLNELGPLSEIVYGQGSIRTKACCKATFARGSRSVASARASSLRPAEASQPASLSATAALRRSVGSESRK